MDTGWCKNAPAMAISYDVHQEGRHGESPWLLRHGLSLLLRLRSILQWNDRRSLQSEIRPLSRKIFSKLSWEGFNIFAYVSKMSYCTDALFIVFAPPSFREWFSLPSSFSFGAAFSSTFTFTTSMRTSPCGLWTVWIHFHSWLRLS